MMKRQNNYRSGIKRGHRLVAIILCAVLVITAVGIGIMITTSISNAEGVKLYTSGGMPSGAYPLGHTLWGTGRQAGRQAGVPLTGVHIAAIVSAMTNGDNGDTEDENADGNQTDESDTGDGADEPASTQDPASIVITKHPEKMSVGASYTIGYTLKNTDGNTVVKWKSSDTDVATVDSEGTVRALAAGKVEITAEFGKSKESIFISVTEKVITPKSFRVEIKEFTAGDIIQTKHNLTIGGILHAAVVVDPAGAKLDGKFVWDVDKGGFISVKEAGDANQNAEITGLKDGDVTLTIRYDGGNVEMQDVKINFTIPVGKPPIDTFFLAIFGGIVAIILIILIALIASRRRRRGDDDRRAHAAQKRRSAEKKARTPRAGRTGGAGGRGDYGGGQSRAPRSGARYGPDDTAHGRGDGSGSDGRRSGSGRSSGSSGKKQPKSGKRSGGSNRPPRRASGDPRRRYDEGTRGDRANRSPRFDDTVHTPGSGYAGEEMGYPPEPEQNYRRQGNDDGYADADSGLTGRSTRVYDTPTFRRPPLSSGYGENLPVNKTPGGGSPGGESVSGGKRFSIDDID